MKSTDRCILAVLALMDCQEVMAARIHLLVHWMRRKSCSRFALCIYNGIPNVPLAKGIKIVL